MKEHSELTIEKRDANNTWVQQVIIPALRKKNFSLTRVLRVLYRAQTRGITDTEFKKQFEVLIGEERHRLAAYYLLKVEAPTRGSTRTLAIIDKGKIPVDITALDAIESVELRIQRSNNDGFYLPPAHRVDHLLQLLASGTEVDLAQASNQEDVIRSISHFALLFDALHPYVDGSGRTMRSAINYLLFPYNLEINFALLNSHADQNQSFVITQREFRDAVQQVEGYPVLTNAVLAGSLGPIRIAYHDMSQKFAQIIHQKRNIPTLQPFYQQADFQLSQMSQPLSSMQSHL